LNYDPQNEMPDGLVGKEELGPRCQSLLRNLEELEVKLFADGHANSSDLCEQCRVYLLSLMKPLNIHFNQEYELVAVASSTVDLDPVTYSSYTNLKSIHPVSSQSSSEMKMESPSSLSPGYTHGGTLLEDLQSIRADRIYRGYSSIIHGDVVVKVDNAYNDLHREVSVLRDFGRNPEYAVVLLEHVAQTSERPGYMVIRRFGEPLTTYFGPNVAGASSFQLLLIRELLHAVSWIHAKSYVHCDIKPENILIHDKGRGVVEVKLCDFDSAVRINEAWKVYMDGPEGGCQLKYSCGWVSPEVHQYNRNLIRSAASATLPFLAKVEMDIFSLGLVLACFLDQNSHPTMTILPSNEKDVQPVFESRSYLNVILCGGDPSLRDAVLRLCAYDPQDRGNLSQMIQLIDSQSRTKLQYQLQAERTWWQQNSQSLISKIESLSQQSLGNISMADLENSLSDVMTLLASHMESQSEDIRQQLEEMKKVVSDGGKKDEIFQGLSEVKRRLDALRPAGSGT
jgi:serine/threonine protein kinase